MKKFLLIAAMAALALGASAQDYKLEKVWEINDVSFLPTLDSRQGFGMNGKFYINNKKQSVDTVDGVEIVTVPTIYEVDENGYRTTDARTALHFYDVLMKHGVKATLRTKHGEDIDAACGQLRAKHEREKEA